MAIARIPSGKIDSPNVTAQAYLAIVLRKPVDARAYKQRVWGEMYEDIFNSGAIEPYVIAVLIHRYTQSWIRQSSYTSDPDDVRRKLAANGTFFIARIASFLWRNVDNYNIGRSLLQQQISDLEANPQLIDAYISEA